MEPSEDQSLLHAEEKPKTDYVAIKRQVLTTVPIASACLIYGIVSGFPSAITTQLKTSSSLHIDSNIESWLASSSLLTTPCGIFLNMIISHKYGRWPALLCTCVAFIIGWMLVFISNSTQMLITSCLLLGVATGLQCLMLTVYIVEISDPRYRGILYTLAASISNVGILLCHFLGTFVEWQYLALLSACIGAITLILALFVPETPYWLAMNDQTTKAGKIYFWLRNDSPTSATEFDLIIQSSNRRRNEPNKWAVILSRSCIKAFVIILITVAISIFSGYNIFVYYARDILNEMVRGVNVDTCVVLVDTIRTVSTLCAFVPIKMLNRKTLFVVSNVSVIVCLVAFIICNVYKVPGHVVMFIVCVHTILLIACLMPVIHLMANEIFPTAARDIGNGICLIIGFLMAFASIKTLPYLIINLGLGMVFGIYGLGLTTCFIILYFLVPETNDLSLPEIEQNLANK